jgi:hypothetical protein
MMGHGVLLKELRRQMGVQNARIDLLEVSVFNDCREVPYVYLLYYIVWCRLARELDLFSLFVAIAQKTHSACGRRR